MIVTSIDPVLGRAVPEHGRNRGVIGEVALSPAGNVVLRVGRENYPAGPGWQQTQTIVLTTDEALDLARRLQALVQAAAL